MLKLSEVKAGEKYLYARYGRLARVIADRIGEKTVALRSGVGYMETTRADPANLIPYSDKAYEDYLRLRDAKDAAEKALWNFLDSLKTPD